MEKRTEEKGNEAITLTQAILIEDLAMLVRVLCRQLPKDNPNRTRAMDYLRRKGMSGTPLRLEDPTSPPQRNGEG